MSGKRKWPVFTEEWAQKIVDEYLEMLCLCWMIDEGVVCKYKVKNHWFWVIYLRSFFPSDIGSDCQYETFIHELIHIFHFIQFLPCREEMVEKECVQFFAEHKNFVTKLLAGILNSPKCLKHSLPEDSVDKNKPLPEDMVKSILNEKYGRSQKPSSFLFILNVSHPSLHR